MDRNEAGYIARVPYNRSRAEIAEAYKVLRKARAKDAAAKAAEGDSIRRETNELGELIVKIRRARSEKTIASLKAKIEAITGKTFYV